VNSRRRRPYETARFRGECLCIGAGGAAREHRRVRRSPRIRHRFDAVWVPRGVRRRLLRTATRGADRQHQDVQPYEWILDIGKHPCDYYLVLTGPPGQARVRPWVIQSVYLFDSGRLIPQLQQLGIKIGVATSVRKQYWEASRIFPARQGSPLDLTDDQVTALRLFSA